MLTLVLLTQEGQKIELSVRPEDTFADLKGQDPYDDALSKSLQLLITNGADVPENTKILDYVTASSQEWFSPSETVDIEDHADRFVTAETQVKECCSQDCSDSEMAAPDKALFLSPADHDQLSECPMEADRPDLCVRVFGLDAESSHKFFMCDGQFSQEASSLPQLCAAEAVSLLKPKNERIWAENMEMKVATTLIKEEEHAFRDVGRGKDSALESLDPAEDLEHPGILCRLCGEPTADPIRLYARDEESEEFGLADKINMCLPVVITVTDPLPKQICEKCRTKLNTCHELALSSLRTEDKLRRLLREKKLCVADATERQCPLCLEGAMRTVKKSGIYRRDDLKNDLCCSAISVSTEDRDDPINFRLADDSTLESTAPHSKSQLANGNSSPLPSEEFSCFDSSSRIDAASSHIPECPVDDEHVEVALTAECGRTSQPEFWEIRCETFTGETTMDPRCGEVSEASLVESAVKTASPTRPPPRRVKQPVRYDCFLCQKQFSRKKSLKLHISTAHRESSAELPKFYRCKTCNEAFAREVDAEAHAMLRHLGAARESAYEELTLSRLYVCEFCERRFTTPSSLHRHRENEHEVPAESASYTCVTCDRAFETHRQLTSHRVAESHAGPFDVLGVVHNYVCKYCDKTFLHYSSLAGHALRHRDSSSPYLCRPCFATFPTYRDVAAHRDVYHPYQSSVHERTSYGCQYCGKQFGYEVALVKHIRTHTGERPYKCSTCGKAFAQSSGLNTHRKIHSDARPYACPECPRAFKIKGDCENHARRHSGARPYKCEFCSKAFMTQHVFSQHRRIHTNDRPYKCDVCGEAFRRSHVLTVHRRIHTGEKPHACDLCEKTYRQRGDLVKHRKVQHGVAAVAATRIAATVVDSATSGAQLLPPL